MLIKNVKVIYAPIRIVVLQTVLFEFRIVCVVTKSSKNIQRLGMVIIVTGRSKTMSKLVPRTLFQARAFVTVKKFRVGIVTGRILRINRIATVMQDRVHVLNH